MQRQSDERGEQLRKREDELARKQGLLQNISAMSRLMNTAHDAAGMQPPRDPSVK